MKLSLLGALCLGGVASAQVSFSEIYISHTGTDTLEFIEVKGTPGASLAGYMVLIVEGDQTSATSTAGGTLDRAYDLGAGTIPASGYYVLGTPTVANVNQALSAQDNFENGTETIYLIQTTNQGTITALVGTSVLTAGGASTTTIPTLATVVEAVGIVDGGYGVGLFDLVTDGATVYGPDGTFLPAGIFRCGDAPSQWATGFLNFDPLLTTGNVPTPGAANTNCGITPPNSGVPFCFGDGSGTACPCGNASAVGAESGCLNSLGSAGKLVGTGNGSIAADTVVLAGTSMTNSSALYFQGTTRAGAGLGTVFGDGLRCAGGTVVRLGTKANLAGASSYPDVGQPSVSVKGLVTVPGTRTYQVWYRNSAAFCNPEGFNLTNGWEIVWTP
jgi:hypothetical protein